MIDLDEFNAWRSGLRESSNWDFATDSAEMHMLEKVVKEKTVYQTSWLGAPALQLPQDLFALQDIILLTRPDLIIETGVAWGGTTLFLASICSLIGHGQVVGIDVNVPPSLSDRIDQYPQIANRVTLIEADSCSEDAQTSLGPMLRRNSRRMVILDSRHTRDHVSRELELFAPHVSRGCYLICGDTHVGFLGPDSYPDKEYNWEDNPLQAALNFLASPDGRAFEIDESITRGYGLSLHPRGYLLKKE